MDRNRWAIEPPRMREILDALVEGALTPRQAEAELRGYVRGEGGRYDAARATRRGIPEAILAEGKTPAEVADLASTALETTDVALVTRADETVRARVSDRFRDEEPTVDITVDERARAVAARGVRAPTVQATVGVVTGGTADAPAAREAVLTLEVMGVEPDLVEDVGVASIDRLLDEIDRLRGTDAIVAAAGREGSLPTVVAGLVDVPVIALPVASGYGIGDGGLAALLGALQSCTVLTTVNVDAGFVAGAQAGLIARSISSARDGT